MAMRSLFWLVVLLASGVLAVFAVSNREAVALAWWPLPFVVETPLYLTVFAATLLGALVGALWAWTAGHRRRRETRHLRRRVAALEQELLATQAQLDGTSPPVQRLAVRG